MKFLGWVFTAILVAGVGYLACHFGWLDGLANLFAK